MHDVVQIGPSSSQRRPLTGLAGRYVYCVADAGVQASLGNVGLEHSEVYTIPWQDICAVVHNCPPQPYLSGDRDAVQAWVMTHQRTVEAAWATWGTVLPLAFDTIIVAAAGGGADQQVADWLSREYGSLKARIQRVKGAAEYGVQVFWDTASAAREVTLSSLDAGKLRAQASSASPGMAYMYRLQLEHLLRNAMEAKGAELSRGLYDRIRAHAAEVRVEKAKQAEPGLRMVLSLSCLVHPDRYAQLGQELDKIGREQGLRVRFTGPWPPYSFVRDC